MIDPRTADPHLFLIRWFLHGKPYGTFGLFPTEEDAEFFARATRNGGDPDCTFRILTVHEFTVEPDIAAILAAKEAPCPTPPAATPATPRRTRSRPRA